MRGAIGTILVVLALLSAGCSRSHYRRQADTDTAAILHEKSCDTPWELSGDYGPYPDPQSRLAHHDDPDCPNLPPSTPRLNSYALPPTGNRRVPTAGSPPMRPTDSAVPLVLSANVADARDSSEVILAVGTDLTHTADQQPGGATPQRARPNLPENASSLPIMKIPESAWTALPASCQSRMLEFETVRDEYQRTYDRNV